MKPVSKHKLAFALPPIEQRQLRQDQAYWWAKRFPDSDTNDADIENARMEAVNASTQWVDEPEFASLSFDLAATHTAMIEVAQQRDADVLNNLTLRLWQAESLKKLLTSFVAFRQRLREQQAWSRLADVAVIEDMLRRHAKFPLDPTQHWYYVPVMVMIIRRAIANYQQTLGKFYKLQQETTPAPFKPSWFVLRCPQYCSPAQINQAIGADAQMHSLLKVILQQTWDDLPNQLLQNPLPFNQLTPEQISAIESFWSDKVSTKNFANHVVKTIANTEQAQFSAALLDQLRHIAADENSDPKLAQAASDFCLALQIPDVDLKHLHFAASMSDASNVLDRLLSTKSVTPTLVDTAQPSQPQSSAS